MNTKLLGIAALALFATQGMADVNVVVPGKAAGYLYLPHGDDDGSISLTLSKEAFEGKPLFTEYRIESDPAGLLCDESCIEVTQKFPEGEVTLKIIGNKPVPGIEIPLTGLWSGACQGKVEETELCLMHVNEKNTQVSVKVNPDLEPGTIIDSPEGKVMYVTMNTAQGYMLVAAHDRPGGSMALMEHNPARTEDPEIKNSNDGRQNMAQLLAEGSPAAQYCNELGSGWYLPARYELANMQGATLTKVPGIKASLWSSTEYEFKYKSEGGGKKQEWKYKTYYLSRSSSTGHGSMSDMTAYEYKLKDYTKVDKDSTEKRQVLCFRRFPI